LLEIGQQLWVAAQLHAPAWVQDRLFPYVYQARDAWPLRPRLAVHRLYGQYQGEPLIVDYVGLEHQPTLATALFSAEPIVREIDRVTPRQLASWADAAEADLAIVAGGQRLIRRLPRRNALVLPFLVTMTLDVSGAWEVVKDRIHKSVRQHEFRLMRKYGYTFELSQRAEDFELFYYAMYVPTVEMRKGSLAAPMSFREAYQYFRHGAQLHLIKQDGRRVAGGLAYLQGNQVRFRLMGMLNADEQLMHEGALAACYYAVVRWANQHGYPAVVFGECVPRLGNGVFQYKRKWGGVVTCSGKAYKQIWIGLRRDTPAIQKFLEDNPLILSDEQGQLQGLIVTSDPRPIAPETEAVWRKQYATPGLSGVLIRSLSDLFEENTRAGRAAPATSRLIQVTE